MYHLFYSRCHMTLDLSNEKIQVDDDPFLSLSSCVDSVLLSDSHSQLFYWSEISKTVEKVLLMISTKCSYRLCNYMWKKWAGLSFYCH